MKKITAEQFCRMVNDATNYYFKQKHIEAIKLSVSKDEKEWLEQVDDNLEGFLEELGEHINKLHLELGGLLNEIVLAENVKFEEKEDEKYEVSIDFDYN